MLFNRTRRPPDLDAAGNLLFSEFDLIEPNGRWRRFRVRSRGERLRKSAFTVALLVSLALWALSLWPLAVAIGSAIR
jgi:hypothetical protein